MKICGWNCRAANSPTAVRSLSDLREHLKPDILFLSESHLNKESAENLRRKLGFDFVHSDESDGRSRGLALFWNEDNKMISEYVCANCIDVVFESSGGSKWRFTGFYSESAWDDKHLSWNCLRDLCNRSSLPWLVLGDFNEILYSEEKEGGNPRPLRMMQEFRNCVSSCELHDMGCTGDKFTWRRAEVRERLDRAVCNSDWKLLFPLASVSNEPHFRSDHRPVLVDTEFYDANLIRRRSGGRKFEARWLAEESVNEIVKTAWEKAKLQGLAPTLASRSKAVHMSLHEWDRMTLKGPKKRIDILKKELEHLRKGVMSPESNGRQKEIQVLIENLMEQEEIYWLQRGRTNWLMHGDRNTSFFHNAATARKRRNQLRKLLDDTGVWKEGEQLHAHVVDYFSHLFTSEDTGNVQGVLDTVHPRVTPAMNEMLTTPFSAEEVKKALFEIGDLKAPGPDGLHAIFYKRFWYLLGDDLTHEVLEAVNTCKIPKGWNDTTIVLIPKVKVPEKVTQLRPISLCNVVYKVISKMLAARLKSLLPEIISPTQSAFVPGRLITDNILVAYECFHHIKNRRQGKKGFCAVKLDMHKAYDRVEWNFLEKIMLKLGFDPSWVKLIMTCVNTVRYRVRVNSEESDMFSPSRGLRQGDPLSPYLFLLCAEGLTGLLAQAEAQEEIVGVKVCRDAPAISNLLFADDSLILMQADEANATNLKRILDEYCQASGQLVSTAKSSVFFSPNTHVEERAAICTRLEIMTEALTDRYLGLPAMVGADRSDSFQFLVDRVCKRINGWKEKLLSSGGKEVLIKAIAQAIPVYAMSVFKIPKQICKGIISAMSNFWWGDGANRKRMHWLSWWKLSGPKNQGGMGFKDIHCFNLALLAKQVWRILEEPESLCARVLRAKYFPNGDLLNAPTKKGSSFTWQSVWAGVQTFKKGHIWRVGNGQNINIWEDEWIPNYHSRKVITPKGRNVLTKVSELINPVTNTWDVELVNQTFG
jgi:hypothetical protein